MRRILVAIDGSDNAMRALDFAARQARYEPAAELHVLNVQSTASSYSAAEIYFTAERIQEIAAERARAILESAAEQLRQVDCRHVLEQLEGEPAATIARRAVELGCESIVLGAHGQRPLELLLMGSVAQRVVNHATMPVTLVK